MSSINTNMLPIYEDVAEILHLDFDRSKLDYSDQSWGVFDYNPDLGLALIHHSLYCDLSKYGWLKGVIVDLVEKRIVCQSYGASVNVSLSMSKDIVPVVSFDKIKPFSSFRFKSLDGQDLTIPEDRVTWVKGHDGTLVRVWKHTRSNKIFISSHKRIMTDKTTWGGCKESFYEMYQLLNGPMDELFPSSDPNAEFNVYSFMIVHPRLQVGSRIPLTHAKLMYLGVHTMEGGSSQSIIPEDILSKFDRPDEFNLEQVNDFLKNGYYPISNKQDTFDPRITNGEFVMLFEFDDSSKSRIKRCIKVMSDAYDWRVRMRNNDPDLHHLLFCVASIKTRDMNTRIGYREYANRYLPIAYGNTPYLDPIILPYLDVKNFQRETAINSLIFATNPSQQEEVIYYFNTYMMFLNDCVQWIYTLWNDPNPQAIYSRMEGQGPDGEHTARRIKNMIEVSTKRLQNQGLEQIEYKRKFSSNIRYLIENEYGDSLYKMFKVFCSMN